VASSTNTITYKKGKPYEINLNELLADPRQPRKNMDAQGLEELTASVVRMGVACGSPPLNWLMVKGIE